MDRDATLVIDSFTLSGWLSQWLAARFPGRSSTRARSPGRSRHRDGHRRAARAAGKAGVVVIGDGGLGIGGMEIETALKHGCRS
jgi:hypothetical protein